MYNISKVCRNLKIPSQGMSEWLILLIILEFSFAETAELTEFLISSQEKIYFFPIADHFFK